MAATWMMAAAREIAIETNVRGLQWGEQLKEEYIVAAIERHSPLKYGVAYMPVPRCDACAHWTTSTQECAALRTGPLNVIYTSPDFGCVKWSAR